jgi:hypothetical protein
MKKFNQYVFIAIIGFVFFLLVYKALNLPVTNDETPTPTAYIHYSVWQIMMFPEDEPNNHILNTLITKLFVALFGNSQLVIRLPNLLCFLIYGFGVFRFNRIVLKEDSIFFIPLALLFVSNPYVLNFFGLCRGYGISCSLAIVSLGYMISGFRDARERHVWIAFVLSMLASYANFTLLIFWGATLIYTLYFICQKPGIKTAQIIISSLWLAVSSLMYLVLIAKPIIRLHQADAFRFWTSNGFYRETIFPFIEYSRKGSHMIVDSHLIAAFIFLTLAVNFIFIGSLFKRSGYKISSLNQPVFIATGILLVTVIINIIQSRVLKTPNLHGRTAMFLYPLFISAFGCMLGIWQSYKHGLAHKIIAFGFAFICIFHLADRFKIYEIKDWWHDVDTMKVIAYLEDRKDKGTVSLKTSWMCYNSFYYYVYTGKTPWLKLEGYDKKIDVNTPAEYYYLFTDDLKDLQPWFTPVKFYGKDRVLVKKREAKSADSF